jgi:ATP-dependent helicase Lhr and Lhr-like helicase
MLHPFHRLAPFIQDFIFAQGWANLRPVQIAACNVILDTDAHLLVAAGTAAGKTEAAFLPVLTQLYNHPPSTVGALYIGPIKALINDQFDRLNDLLQHADIPVWAWHGDIAQSQKKRLLKNPKGILQITPESLESLLINKHADLERIFGDLRFVIIDEVHTFIGSDRGAQLLCQLTRLTQLTQNPHRRIGLSATLGDYGMAEDWLRSGTSNPVITPPMDATPRTIHLSLEHFFDPGLIVRTQDDARDQSFNPCHIHLFNQSKERKCLIFANGRMETENVIAQLRQIAAAKGEPDIYHVHHGSISAPLREAAETAMRDARSPTVTAATVTFEMGIDLGQLDRVIQLESPPSVASFLQRLGRSGRRGSPADMRFVCQEEAPTVADELPQQMPWQLLQCIAIIQLYLEDKWIEPISPVQYPFSLLYQQTLSTLTSLGELSPAALAQRVLTLPPFRQITQDDFRLFLRQLIALDHIQRTPENGLILGVTGERIVGNFKFYAIFPDQQEYTVLFNGAAIGCIVQPPNVGDRFSLAGRTWQALEVNAKLNRVTVQPATGASTLTWRGSSGDIHTRILQRMQKVLIETVPYPYLQPGAHTRLQQARQLAKKYALDRNYLFPLEDNFCCILPWCGTLAYRTLERYLRLHCRDALKFKGVYGKSPYYIVLNLGEAHLEGLRQELKSLVDRPLKPEDLLKPEEAPKIQKYDEFIPESLLRKSFAHDQLNIPELRDLISRW